MLGRMDAGNLDKGSEAIIIYFKFSLERFAFNLITQF